MNILFVTPFFIEKSSLYSSNKHSEISGMPMYIYRTAKMLIQAGHRIKIVCGGSTNVYEVLDGISVWRVNTLVYISGKRNKYIKILADCGVANWVIQKKVNEICKQHKIDIIQYAGSNGMGMFHYMKIPCVIRVSSYYKLTFSKNFSYDRIEVLLHSFFERSALRHVNNVYCPSKIMSEYLSKEVGRKIKIIETSFYNEIIEQDYSVYNKKLKSKKYILYYGRLCPEKGVMHIAEIAERVLSKYKDCYIVIVGSNRMVEGKSTLAAMKRKAGKAAAARMIYLSPVPHIQLYPIIDNAMLILQPSYMENLSNACMEAMSFGKIVIGTNGASYEQLIEDGVNGYLANIADSDSLYQCIEKAMSMSWQEKEEMGKRAKESMERLKPEIKVPELIRYYRKVIKEIG